jgi:hypothetical protein
MVVVDWINVAHDEPMAGSCEHGDDPLFSINGG